MGNTYNNELKRRIMGTGEGTGLPMRVGIPADLLDDQKGGKWYIPADPNKGIKEGIDYPLLAGYIIDQHGLTRDARGRIGNASGQLVTNDDLYRYLRDEITKVFPDKPEYARNAFHVLVDKLPSSGTPDTAADNVGAYIAGQLREDIRSFVMASNVSTGFNRFDNLTGGLYPGLYVMAAISSLGKTTFIHQVADQIAAAGKHVLYFSLEMSRLELVSKSISRTMAQAEYSSALSSMEIRRGTTSRPMEAALDAYAAAIGDRMNIIEGGFDTTASYIGDYARAYVERTGEHPVIIIDYLQIILGDAATILESTDANVVELKRLSRSLDVPIIVISSVNRANYLLPVDFESLKHSGSIEYTADVVLGLQLACMDDPLFSQEKQITEKRKRVKEAKSADPREVKLVCLKNRYGGTDWTISYKYYPRFDLFEEQDGFKEVSSPTPWSERKRL